MGKREDPIVTAFWNGVSDTATFDDLADGRDITFTYGGSEYTVNTKVFAKPRVHSMPDYVKALEKAAIAQVRG